MNCGLNLSKDCHENFDNNVNTPNNGRKKRRHRRDKMCCGNHHKEVFKVAFNNVNRSKPKIDEVAKLMKDEDICIFGFAETFLKYDNAVNIGDYKWCGKNRNNDKCGGGVGFLIDKHATILDDNVMNSKFGEFERSWLKIILNTVR